MKPAVAGMPGQAEHRERHRPGQQRPRRAEPRDRGDVVAQRRLALAGDDHRERRQVHHQVDGEVEDRRLHAEPRGDDDAGEHVAGLRDRRPGHQALERGLAERADVADDDRDRRQHGERRAPSRSLASISATSNRRSKTPKRGRLRRDGHERGDRRRRALVDVGRPLVEGRDRGLEGQADDAQRDAGQQQRIVDDVGRRRRSRCPTKSVDAGRAVDEAPGRRAASPTRPSR